MNKLDCSKLIPCSESLVTINIDDQFSPGKCQVSSLSVVQNLVYIGTCWGCLVVAESASLRPVTVFRPYSAEIPSLASLRPTQGAQCLVSVGRGYRNLIKRSVSSKDDIIRTPQLTQAHLLCILGAWLCSGFLLYFWGFGVVMNLSYVRYCINRMKEEDEDFVSEHSLYVLLWSTDSWVME